MRISDWSSDVCSSDLAERHDDQRHDGQRRRRHGFGDARYRAADRARHARSDDAADDRAGPRWRTDPAGRYQPDDLTACRAARLRKTAGPPHSEPAVFMYSFVVFWSRWIANQAIFRRFKSIKPRSEEHTSELQSLMRISYAVFCLKKKKKI